MVSDAFDVIVVGFGFAGGIAAITAADAGARVLLLEKQQDAGGISVCSEGGLRIAKEKSEAFNYLSATNAGTAPEAALLALAAGMTGLADYVKSLAEPFGATVVCRDSAGHYPFPGADTFGFATIEALPGYDHAIDFPQVRGGVAGARLFKLVLNHVRSRPTIEVRLATQVQRLLQAQNRVVGVRAGGQEIRCHHGVILACGGFEGDAEMQRQFWHLKPVVSAAMRANMGDGIRMAQSAGAALWHMRHFHGAYGFRHPDPAYPFGIRVKKLPDWRPGFPPKDVRMSWILVDCHGQRFMNEYEPYMQDTAYRALGAFDPAMQAHPRIPSYLILDAAGRARYPVSAPTWHDRAVAQQFGTATAEEFDEQILISAGSITGLAEALGLPPESFVRTIDEWNQACAAQQDAAFGRPAMSMLPIAQPPYYGARVWPVVSNTQGGPVHDERQRVLDAFGVPIAGLFAVGELGSVFGHLYLSGGNLAECFIGGRIAGLEVLQSTA